ncbi:hypothetical protein EGW08_017332 [Elysia chlorotica]|uniref:THD domain-containing protein n=1 Tax=Elysia chlorotica TaxID=188477 RepID=A0A3S0ZCZ2_ELYCH|nr:hypothetical protein EGW08_017332 [Elysia chlorotica]
MRGLIHTDLMSPPEFKLSESITEPSSITSMAKDTRVTFDSATNNNNGTTTGALSPNGMGGGGGGPGGLGFGMGHHHTGLAPHQQAPAHLLQHQNHQNHQHHHSAPHKSKLGRGHSRIAERQVSTEDAENCINEISESFPALSNKAHRLMRQVSGSFNSRTLKVALIFSIMLNIVMGISFGVFFGMWMSWDRNGSGDGGTGSGSGDSSGISGHHRPTSQAFTGHHGGYHLGGQEVLAHGKSVNPAVMAALGSKIAANQNTIEAICAYCPARPCANQPPSGSGFGHGGAASQASELGRGQEPPKCVCVNEAFQSTLKTLSAAHMMLDVYETKKQKSLIWLTHDADNICYVGEGVRYERGELTILHTGQYHVYSQVTFSTIDNPMPSGMSELLLLFSIQRRPRQSGGSPRSEPVQTILLSKLTMEPGQEENDMVSGIVKLTEGDVLSVYISHPSLLKNTLPANYFGVFKM